MSGNLDHSPSSSPWEPGSPSSHEYINPIYFCWHTFRMLSHLKNIWNISFLQTMNILIKSSFADTHSERNLWNISKCIQFESNSMNISTKHIYQEALTYEMSLSKLNLQQNSSSTNQQGSKRHYCDQSQDLPPPLPPCEHCVHTKDVVNFSI